MKKARFLSLLLAAVMTASAMPTFAVASAAADAPAAGEFTYSGTATAFAAEDGYLSIGGRTDRWHGLQYQYNFKYGTKYRITFDGRQSVPSDKTLNMRAQSSEAGQLYYQSWAYLTYYKNNKEADGVQIVAGKDIINPNGFHWMDPSKGSSSDTNVATNTKWKTDYPTGTPLPDKATYDNNYKSAGDNIHWYTYDQECNWTTTTYEFQFCDKPGTADTVLARFAFCGGTNSVYTQPMDIDNFKLEVYENEQWKRLEFYDFDTTAPIAACNSTASGVFKLGNSTKAASSDVAKVLALTTNDDSAFTRVDKVDGTNTAITYTPDDDIVLTPGIYEISADVRYAASIQATSPTDKTNITLAAELDGVSTTIKAADVYNGWTTLSGSVMVLKDTPVSKISLTANSAAPVDFKDISVTSVSTFDHLGLDVLGTSVTPVMSESGSNIVLTYDIDNAAITNGIYAVTASANGNAGNYTADVTYTLSDDSTVTKSVSFNTENETVLTYLSLLDGVTVKNITITTDANACEGSKFAVKYVDVDEILDLDDDNLLDGVNASYTGIVENIEMDPEGYLHIPERTEAQSNNYITIDLGDKTVADRTYYVGFNIRTSVPGEKAVIRPLANYAIVEAQASEDNRHSVTGMNGNYFIPTDDNKVDCTKNNAAEDTVYDPKRVFYQYNNLNNTWQYLEGMITAKDSGNNNTISFNRGASGYDAGKAALDIDNITAWYFDENNDKVVIFAENFDTEGAPLTGITPKNGIVFKNVVATSHTKLTPVEGNNAVVVYDVSESELTDGVFTFTADVSAEKAGTAKVIYTLSDGTVVEGPEAELGEEYVSVSGIASVADDVTIESIKLETTVDAVIRYRNVYLDFTEFDTVSTDEEDNVLQDAVIKVEGAVPNVIVEDAPDGTVVVGTRPSSGTDNFLNFNLGFTPKEGVTYYVGFDIMAYADQTDDLCVRPKLDFAVEESLDLNNKFVVMTENSEIGKLVLSTKIDPDTGDPVHDKDNSYQAIYVTPGDWYYYEGSFTPVETPKGNAVVHIGRGPGTFLHTFEVNNFVVWYMDGDEKVVVYKNDFDSADDMTSITTAAGTPVKQNIPVTRTEYVPADPAKPVVINIEPNIAEAALVDGAYIFSFDMKTSEAQAEAKSITVTYTFKDETTYTEVVTVNSEWTTVTLSRALSKDNPVVNVNVTMENPVAFEITHPSLILRNHKHDGLPNFGVVMMLLYKKAGGVKKVTEEVEFIENGDLSVEPIIHNEPVPKAVTVEDAGFWAKQAAANPTTVSYVTEKGNSFVRIKDLDAGQRGIWYNTGIELEPGTYTFKVDVRVSEQPNETNYTAYDWRDGNKNSMMMRTILQNPNGVGSGNYATFDPVDKDAAMNKDGIVTGTQYVVTRDWFTLTDVITIDRPTVIIFKIGGGMSGNPDAHGFDIDNLSLTGIKTYYKKNGEIADPSELPEEVTKVEETPNVDGNLIINGDFDEEPTVIPGDKYDESKANAWFQNDGMGYKKDNTGKDITTEPQIQINQKITWTDGYLTFSGRTNNLRNFWYNSGVTVEPGTYKLTLDFKTAKEGETSSIRCAVDKLYNPAATDALAIDNTWKTMTIGFTANAATPIKLTFWGGPSAGFIQDFCVDNITLVKVG